MRVKEFIIKNFRSIENISIHFPLKKPVILFGPNNVGKSNIMKAFDYMLGEKYTTKIDFVDSDYFLRDKDNYKCIYFQAILDEPLRPNKSTFNNICFSTNITINQNKDNYFHTPISISEPIQQLYINSEDRERCQFLLIDATRDISRQFSNYSSYTILNRTTKNFHNNSSKKFKDDLIEKFNDIKLFYQNNDKYLLFYENLQKSFSANIDGFTHKLSIDFSPYDPNNLFKTLNISAIDGTQVRSFDEFGTGEQQVLLMSFIKAYAETFKGINFILGIEEPEAHLHPIAQKWLANNIKNIASSGIQIVISTHSPEFLDIDCLEGFVKVYKEDNITKTIQINAQQLTQYCINNGSDKEKTSDKNILEFYKSCTFYDHLRGFFARKIILVEGETELFSLPNYFNYCGYDLIKNGVEIVNCHSKTNITKYYRLFTAYHYPCFCIFDADLDKDKSDNTDFANTFDFVEEEMEKFGDQFVTNDLNYGYFSNNFEKYMRGNIENYKNYEEQIHHASKPLKAKIISEEHSDIKPTFIENIALALSLQTKEDVDKTQ